MAFRSSAVTAAVGVPLTIASTASMRLTYDGRTVRFRSDAVDFTFDNVDESGERRDRSSSRQIYTPANVVIKDHEAAEVTIQTLRVKTNQYTVTLTFNGNLNIFDAGVYVVQASPTNRAEGDLLRVYSMTGLTTYFEHRVYDQPDRFDYTEINTWYQEKLRYSENFESPETEHAEHRSRYGGSQADQNGYSSWTREDLIGLEDLPIEKKIAETFGVRARYRSDNGLIDINSNNPLSRPINTYRWRDFSSTRGYRQ